MARRRRRRRRGRRRSSAPVGLILGSVVAVLVLIAGGLAYTNGAFDGLVAGEEASGLTGVSASSDRFHGADGIDVGDITPVEYWWTDPTAIISEPETASSVPNNVAGEQFQEVQIPADVLFEADSAELSAGAYDAIRSIADTVADPSLRIIVVCHSSADGSIATRQTLSEDRADALAGALEELLDRARGSITRIGKGDSEPLPGIDQSTSEGRALNRRCEVFIQFN